MKTKMYTLSSIFFPQCKKKNIFEKQRFGICHTAAWNDTPHNSPDHKISQQTRPCLSKKSKWTKTRIFTLYCYYNTKFKKKNIFEKQFLGIYHTCTVWNDTPHNLSCLNFSKKAQWDNPRSFIPSWPSPKYSHFEYVNGQFTVLNNNTRALCTQKLSTWKREK